MTLDANSDALSIPGESNEFDDYYVHPANFAANSYLASGELVSQSPASIPEPGTLWLAFPMVAFLYLRRRFA